MSFTYGFYNAIDHDRTYSASQFSEMFDGLINDGVYATIGEAFMVVPGSGMTVMVKSGRAWFNKTWSVNSTDMPLDLGLPDLLLPRKDTVVLEVDTRLPVRANCLKIVNGYPSTNPSPASLTQSDGCYQYPLAYVTVKANAIEITKSDIEITVGRAPCPFVTGIIQTNDITDLYQQWEGRFETWFANVQAQLSGDIAANLQRQITDLSNNKVDKSAKATQAEASAGTNNDKYLTPYAAKNAITNAIIQGSEGAFQIGDIVNGPILPNNNWHATDGSVVDLQAYKNLKDSIGFLYGIGSKTKSLEKLDTNSNAGFRYDTYFNEILYAKHASGTSSIFYKIDKNLNFNTYTFPLLDYKDYQYQEAYGKLYLAIVYVTSKNCYLSLYDGETGLSITTPYNYCTLSTAYNNTTSIEKVYVSNNNIYIVVTANCGESSETSKRKDYLAYVITYTISTNTFTKNTIYSNQSSSSGAVYDAWGDLIQVQSPGSSNYVYKSVMTLNSVSTNIQISNKKPFSNTDFLMSLNKQYSYHNYATAYLVSDSGSNIQAVQYNVTETIIVSLYERIDQKTFSEKTIKVKIGDIFGTVASNGKPTNATAPRSIDAYIRRILDKFYLIVDPKLTDPSVKFVMELKKALFDRASVFTLKDFVCVDADTTYGDTTLYSEIVLTSETKDYEYSKGYRYTYNLAYINTITLPSIINSRIKIK